MTIVKNISDLSNIIADQYSKSLKIGLVPTMGSLHNGHLSLIKIAKEKCDVVWVSIFINPTQFNNLKDYESYPKQNLNDIKILKSVSSSIYVFFPAVNEIYNKKIVAQKFKFDNINKVLEGKKRSGHFDGVATIIMKLFKIFKPSMAFFGEKDYQQTLVIKRMVSDLLLPVEVLTLPIIREENGLAMSSRNSYLNESEKQLSSEIYKAIEKAATMVRTGADSLDDIEKNSAYLLEELGFKVEYFSIRRRQDLKLVNDSIDKTNTFYFMFCSFFIQIRYRQPYRNSLNNFNPVSRRILWW